MKISEATHFCLQYQKANSKLNTIKNLAELSKGRKTKYQAEPWRDIIQKPTVSLLVPAKYFV